MLREIPLKVENHCKEDISAFPIVRVPFEAKSSWFKSASEVLKYELAKLAGMNLRTVYQQGKGRDLFDLWRIMSMRHELAKRKLIDNYERHLGFTASHLPMHKEFMLNMNGELQDEEFLTDTGIILGLQV